MPPNEQEMFYHVLLRARDKTRVHAGIRIKDYRQMLTNDCDECDVHYLTDDPSRLLPFPEICDEVVDSPIALENGDPPEVGLDVNVDARDGVPVDGPSGVAADAPPAASEEDRYSDDEEAPEDQCSDDDKAVINCTAPSAVAVPTDIDGAPLAWEHAGLTVGRYCVPCSRGTHGSPDGKQCEKRRQCGVAQTAVLGPIEPIAYLGVWREAAHRFSTRALHKNYVPKMADMKDWCARHGYTTS